MQIRPEGIGECSTIHRYIMSVQYYLQYLGNKIVVCVCMRTWCNANFFSKRVAIVMSGNGTHVFTVEACVHLNGIFLHKPL